MAKLINGNRKQALERLEYSRKVNDSVGVAIALAELSVSDVYIKGEARPDIKTLDDGIKEVARIAWDEHPNNPKNKAK